jgi:DNA-binding SARP family transcriptional activator
MRYEILGPLRVISDEGQRSLTAQKTELLLAALLIQADQVLTVDQLVAEIWPAGSPRRAIATLQVYVSQLRKFLGRREHSKHPIRTHPSGYMLCLDSDRTDFHAFTDLMSAGRRDARVENHESARSSFESALGLYRGRAIGGASGGPIIGQFSTWLEESRLECTESLIESQMALGRHRDIIGQLYSLTVEHPFRETFYRQLMLALYRSERQADALRVYKSARTTLHSELGVEPCRQLQELQHAVLVADKRLEAPGIASASHAL